VPSCPASVTAAILIATYTGSSLVILMVVVISVVTDVIYALLDPRVNIR
jgi:ABC-type dipeptide/oligopeptide/nickel transport system permease component